MNAGVNTSAHLSETELAALVYPGGRDSGPERRAHSHIAVCAECEELVRMHRRADNEAALLLSSLDVTAPVKPVTSVIRAAQRKMPRRDFGRRRAAAAAIFLTVAAAAAAAIPASPLHRVLTRMFGGTAAPTERSASALAETRSPNASPGVSFSTTPGAPLEIVFDGTGGGLLEVRISAGDQVALSSPTTGSHYRVSTNRITIEQPALGNFKLDIPRSLGRLSVRVGSKLIFERGPGLQSGPATFTIQLTRPRGTVP